MTQSTNRSPVFEIDRTAYLLRAAVTDALASAGWDCTPQETQAMLTLHESGEALTMGDLAEKMIRDATTVKRQLDRLVDKKFVVRKPSKQDGRITLVHLTRRGESKLKQMMPILRSVKRRAFSGIPKRELDSMMETLLTVRENLT